MSSNEAILVVLGAAGDDSWRHIGGSCIVVMSMHAIFVSYER